MVIEDRLLGKVTPIIYRESLSPLYSKIESYIRNGSSLTIHSVECETAEDGSDIENPKVILNCTAYMYVFFTRYHHYLEHSKTPLDRFGYSEYKNISLDDIEAKRKESLPQNWGRHFTIAGSGNLIFIPDRSNSLSLQGSGYSGYLFPNCDRNTYQRYIIEDYAGQSSRSYCVSSIIYRNFIYGKSEEYYKCDFLSQEDYDIGIIQDTDQSAKENPLSLPAGRANYNQDNINKDKEKVNNKVYIHLSDIYDYSSYINNYRNSPYFKNFKIGGAFGWQEFIFDDFRADSLTAGFADNIVVKGSQNYPWTNTEDLWFQSSWNTNHRRFFVDEKTGYFSEDRKWHDYGRMFNDEYPLHVLGIDLYTYWVNHRKDYNFETPHEYCQEVLNQLFDGTDYTRYTYHNAQGTPITPSTFSSSTSKRRFMMMFMNKADTGITLGETTSFADFPNNNIYVDTYAAKRYCAPDFWTGRLLCPECPSLFTDYLSKKGKIEGPNKYLYVLGQNPAQVYKAWDGIYGIYGIAEGKNYGIKAETGLEYIPEGDEFLLLTQYNWPEQNDLPFMYKYDLRITETKSGDICKILDVQDIQAHIIKTDEFPESKQGKQLYIRELTNEITVPDNNALISMELYDLLYHSNVDDSKYTYSSALFHITRTAHRYRSDYWDYLFSRIPGSEDDKKRKRAEIRKKILARNNLYDKENIANGFALCYVNALSSKIIYYQLDGFKVRQEIFKNAITENGELDLNKFTSDKAVSNLVYSDGSNLFFDMNLAIKGKIGTDEENPYYFESFLPSDNVGKKNYFNRLFNMQTNFQIDNVSDTFSLFNKNGSPENTVLEIGNKIIDAREHRYQNMYFFPVRIDFKIKLDKECLDRENPGDGLSYSCSVYKGDNQISGFGGFHTYPPSINGIYTQNTDGTKSRELVYHYEVRMNKGDGSEDEYYTILNTRDGKYENEHCKIHLGSNGKISGINIKNSALVTSYMKAFKERYQRDGNIKEGNPRFVEIRLVPDNTMCTTESTFRYEFKVSN